MSAAKEKIIIDKDKGLEFKNEEDMYSFFEKDIKKFETELTANRSKTDLAEKEYTKYENQLEDLIEDPDEVWEETSLSEQNNLAIFIKFFEKTEVYHIALTYLTEDIPSFIYLHFPTTDQKLVSSYRRGEMIYDKVADNKLGAIEGDSLYEGDSLARGLYEAMLKLRSHDDIPEEEFINYAQFREEGIEKADEIWRSNSSLGNALVTFIKEFTLENDELFYYLSVTQEDEESNTHALLFSFPTSDSNLIDRYRNGENLQAEEVVQESSH